MTREERIRERAYQIWESEGRPSDRHDEHWRRAEVEIEEEWAVAGSPGSRPPAEDGTQNAVRPVTSRPIPARKRDDNKAPGGEKKARTAGSDSRSP